jgi:hypothetical protein
VTLNSAYLRPKSRGTVKLTSADPAAAPLLDPNYWSDPHDMEMAIKGLRLAREIMSQPAMKRYVQSEVLPGARLQSDAELFDYACANAKTDHHPVGTCRMGPPADSASVVTPDLKLIGLEGLRVVDASVGHSLRALVQHQRPHDHGRREGGRPHSRTHPLTGIAMSSIPIEPRPAASAVPQDILDGLTDVDLPRLPNERPAHEFVSTRDVQVPLRRFRALVIGSGAAGLRAAVELKRRGVDVVVATQSAFGGTSACSGSDKQTLHTANSADQGDNFRTLADAIGAGGSMDADTAYVEAVGSARALASLQYLGLPIPQDRLGGVLRYQTDHDEGGRATS